MEKKAIKTFLLLSILPILITLNFSLNNSNNKNLFDFNDNKSTNKTLEDNPYIVENSFKSNLITNNTLQFQMEVIGSFTNNENINVTINGDNEPYKTAKRIDNDEDDIYIYEVDNLNYSTNYDFYSLNNTDLAYASASNPIDEEIELKNEMNITNTSFTTNKNPTITNFWINKDSITTNTITFGITVYNYSNVHLNIEDSINVSLKNLSTNEYENFNAPLISYEGNLDQIGEINLTYEIQNLNPGIMYKFISLNNTDLAINSGDNLVDEEILIEEELGVIDNEFSTIYLNPFILNQGFEITNSHGTIVEFALTINDEYNTFNYFNPLKVKLNNSDGEIVTAKYLKKEGNKYYYQISGLEENTDYSIYSLVDTNLAIENNGNVVDNEILINEELSVSNNFFTTEKMDELELDGMSAYWFPVIIGIFILIVAILIGYKVKKNEF